MIGKYPKVIELFKYLELFSRKQLGTDGLWWEGYTNDAYKINIAYKMLIQSNLQI